MNTTGDPESILKEIARGSFGKVIESNNRLILIKTNTEKVKNTVLREFIEEARKDKYTDADLVDILLTMDQAVEENTVKKTLNEFL